MEIVSVSIHEARISRTFFGGLKASWRWKLKKKMIILENTKSNELSLVFSKIVSNRALMWQSLGDFDFFILHPYPWYLQEVALFEPVECRTVSTALRWKLFWSECKLPRISFPSNWNILAFFVSFYTIFNEIIMILLYQGMCSKQGPTLCELCLHFWFIRTFR